MMSDKNDAAVSSREEQAPLGFRGPPQIGPSGKSGAFIAEGDEAEDAIRQWLERYGIHARAYSVSQADELIQHVANGRFMWIVVESSSYALKSQWFDRLFRASIETDTELWTADDNTEFGLHLFCSMMANWEFLTPYIPDSTEASSLTSVRDALSRIETRIRANATEVIPTEGRSPVEDSPILSQPGDGLIVKNGLVIDTNQFTVAYKGQQCFLGETILFRVAESLGRAPGKWHSFGELRSDVWKDYDVEDSTVGRTLRLLRNKLMEAKITGITIVNPRNMKRHARLLIS